MKNKSNPKKREREIEKAGPSGRFLHGRLEWLQKRRVSSGRDARGAERRSNRIQSLELISTSSGRFVVRREQTAGRSPIHGAESKEESDDDDERKKGEEKVRGRFSRLWPVIVSARVTTSPSSSCSPEFISVFFSPFFLGEIFYE